MKSFFCLLLFIASIHAQSQNSDLTVIANKSGSPAQLSLAQLQNVFKGNQAKWSNGEKVVIAMMKLNTADGKLTCDKVYQMSADAVTKHWLALSIKGSIDAPVFFNSASELISFVASTHGAIAVLNAGSAVTNVQTVLVDGKKAF